MIQTEMSKMHPFIQKFLNNTIKMSTNIKTTLYREKTAWEKGNPKREKLKKVQH